MSATLSKITAEEYHADPCDGPSLSASIIHTLLSQSPAHAWIAHPRLNPNYAREEKSHYDLGTVAHAMLLEGSSNVVTVDAKDWRTKAAREERDAAYAAGMTPMLIHDIATVEAMVKAAREQLAAHDASDMFTNGAPEQTITWTEKGVQCRALLDWLHDDRMIVDDYKTTGRSASPESWIRSSLFGNGADLQAMFYMRGVTALTGVTPSFRFAVQETTPPYALSVIAPGPDVMVLAAEKIEYALGLWRDCLERDHWPAYPTSICYAELPSYEEARWLAREEAMAA